MQSDDVRVVTAADVIDAQPSDPLEAMRQWAARQERIRQRMLEAEARAADTVDEGTPWLDTLLSEIEKPA